MTHFIAVDGEGVTDESGKHDYVLLSVGDNSLHDNGRRLTFTSICRFLYRQFQLNHRSAFIGYYLSYDFSQWLKDLPEKQAWLLLSAEGIALRQRKNGVPDPWPVRWAGWEFDILGMRRFKLRPATLDPINIPNVHQWMWICDSGPFWQTSFVNAINPKGWPEPVCTDDEWRIIVEGKAARSSAVFDSNMELYNRTENRVLAKAMSRMDSGFRSQGWKLNKRQWFGPGQAADLWLRQIGAPTREQIEKATSSEVLTAAQQSYYGGWFEIPRHGHIPGAVYEYDINSAYPFTISGLPCLLHGEWRPGGDTATNDGWQLCHVTAHGSNQYLGGLPHRDVNGIITRPHFTKGWYWAHEINAAIRAGLLDSCTVLESFMWHPRICECRYPFRSIERLYQHRLSLGKDTATGKAIKLVYNSAYGKFAQSVGTPRFANALYASLITSGCRTMILDAIATHPNGARDVVMIATDGIYFRTPHLSLPLSKTELGKWDDGIKENLTLFMPGVYWDDSTRASIESDSVKIKSRGINADALARCIDRVDMQFRLPFAGWPEVIVPVAFSVVTPKLAMSRGKWWTNGSIVTNGRKVLSSDPVNKRQNLPYDDDGVWTTRPYRDKGPSVGYNKSFGADIELLINGDLETDDGTVNDEFMGLLHG